MAPVGSGSGGACGRDCRRTDGEVTVRLRTITCDWENDMAKGQKRSNREAKKPKAGKKKTVAASGTVPDAVAKSKSGTAAPTTGKK
jgi:hypothetical protein